MTPTGECRGAFRRSIEPPARQHLPLGRNRPDSVGEVPGHLGRLRPWRFFLVAAELDHLLRGGRSQPQLLSCQLVNPLGISQGRLLEAELVIPLEQSLVLGLDLLRLIPVPYALEMLPGDEEGEDKNDRDQAEQREAIATPRRIDLASEV